ncbi:MAG: DUF924 family protein [Neisseria sp.]|uniref:DUF924 family protein n=1 Tax=Neisseria sp. TaxID=192066 RepID=UPI0026DD08B0|nr:DUF924 family protein [Neisseria sp.]MDO4640724.1 DUF924 family protein [Neisseria sp.]
MDKQTVLDFWFSESTQPFWFQKSDDFDQSIRTQFFPLWQQAAQSELYHWRTSPEGRLAEIIVLDQFSRNLFRNSPQAFAQDNMAVALTQEALRQDGFARLPEMWRKFTLMPLMHSESRLIHEQAMLLFNRHADPHTLEFEAKHKAIIDRFGRYPHRNAVLGRKSTPEEIEFLQQPSSSF